MANSLLADECQLKETRGDAQQEGWGELACESPVSALHRKSNPLKTF